MQHHGPLCTSWMGSPLPRGARCVGATWDTGPGPAAASEPLGQASWSVPNVLRGMAPPAPETGLTSDLSHRPKKPFAFGVGSR